MSTKSLQDFQQLFQDFEVHIIEKNMSPQELMNLYFSLLDKGKTEQFHPIIVKVDDTLLEKFEIDLEDDDLDFSSEGMATLRKKNLSEAQEIDASNYYNEEKEELREELEEVYFEEPEDDEVEFVSHLNDDGSLAKNIVILKIPTSNPYEALAWLPIGGFNDCPSPELMVAMTKHWHTKYGAIPSVITYDTIEFFVPNPPSDREQLYDLGMEQFLFDVDIVEQGVGCVEALIETLYKNKQWYFWWD